MNSTKFFSRYGEIHYEISGPKNGVCLIFTHGVGMNSKTFDLQKQLLSLNYKIVLWDLPGHGKSTLSSYNKRYTELSADCLYELMEEVG